MQRVSQHGSSSSQTAAKDGWYRTWPDKPDDGVFWRQGYKMGRIYRHVDDRWMWFSWCGASPSGIAATKDAAKAQVERYADLSALTVSSGDGLTSTGDKEGLKGSKNAAI